MTSVDLIVCMPVYNDWESATLLIREIDGVVGEMGLSATVLMINDGSSEAAPMEISGLVSLKGVEVLELRRNLGHQRAIATALAYLHAHRSAKAVAVMDADGEDSPNHLAQLYDCCQRSDFGSAVFAARRRRTEGLFFKLGYRLYQTLHRLLTGTKVEVGNFSVLPWSFLERLVTVSEMWSHYAASVAVSKLPMEKLYLDRGERLCGQTKMNTVTLVTHGLRAISVYEQVGVRILAGCSLVGLVSILAAAGAFLTEPLLALLLVVAVIALIMISVTFVFVNLQTRNSSQFLPVRDYHHFIAEVHHLNSDA